MTRSGETLNALLIYFCGHLAVAVHIIGIPDDLVSAFIRTFVTQQRLSVLYHLIIPSEHIKIIQPLILHIVIFRVFLCKTVKIGHNGLRHAFIDKSDQFIDQLLILGAERSEPRIGH